MPHKENPQEEPTGRTHENLGRIILTLPAQAVLTLMTRNSLQFPNHIQNPTATAK